MFLWVDMLDLTKYFIDQYIFDTTHIYRPSIPFEFATLFTQDMCSSKPLRTRMMKVANGPLQSTVSFALQSKPAVQSMCAGVSSDNAFNLYYAALLNV